MYSYLCLQLFRRHGIMENPFMLAGIKANNLQVLILYAHKVG